MSIVFKSLGLISLAATTAYGSI